jgi:hypothetical protein
MKREPTGPHAVAVFNLGMDQHQQQQLRVVLGQPGKLMKATTTTAMGKSSSPAGQVKKRRRQSWVGLLATKMMWRKRRDQAVKKWMTSSSNATQRRQLGEGGKTEDLEREDVVEEDMTSAAKPGREE